MPAADELGVALLLLAGSVMWPHALIPTARTRAAIEARIIS